MKLSNETGADEGFCDRGRPRETVYNSSIGTIGPIRTANGALLEGASGSCSSGKMFEIEVIAQ